MRWWRGWVVLIGGVVGACAPTIGPTTPPVEVLVVLDSLDDTLRVIPVDSPTVVHRVPLEETGAAMTALALNGEIAAIGLNLSGRDTLDNMLLMNLGLDVTLCGGPIPLHGRAPVGAIAFGPGGEAYAVTPTTDSVATVFSNCGVQQGSVPQGPAGFGVARGTVYAVVSNRTQCLPQALNCPSWLSPLPYRRNDSIPLLGPGGATSGVFGPDGYLYVINAGTGQSDGVLSKYHPGDASAVGIPGFGHLPKYIATDGSGRIYVVSATDGLMVYNTGSNQVDRGAGAGVPVGDPVGITVDDEGHIYLPQHSTCAAGDHGTISVLGADLVARPSLTVGRCPVAVGVTEIPAADYRFN